VRKREVFMRGWTEGCIEEERGGWLSVLGLIYAIAQA